MTEYRAIAEKWAGPHEVIYVGYVGEGGDPFVLCNGTPCDCPRRKRIEGIAEALGEAEDLGEHRGLAVAAEKFAADLLAARREGRESMREEAAALVERSAYRASGIPTHENIAERIRALPIEKGGEG